MPRTARPIHGGRSARARLERSAAGGATHTLAGVRRAYASTLADREFLKLWSGSLVSTLGFHISVLAMQLTAVLVLRASPLQMGLLVGAQFLPQLLFSLVAGVWIDRLPRRPVLIAADLGRAAALASVPLAYAVDLLRIEQLYLVAFTIGSLSMCFEIAVRSYVPDLVTRTRVVEANSDLQAGEAVAQIAGPNLAGTLVQWLTAPVALLFDACSYLVSAACLLWIRRPEPDRATPAMAASVWRQAREGLATVGSHPLLRAPMLAALTYGFFAGGIRGALIVLYLVSLGVSPLEFGVIYSIGGAAALAGAILTRPVTRHVGLGSTLVHVHLLAGLFAAFVPLAGLVPQATLPLLLAGQIGLSLVSPLWGINATSLQQTVTPPLLLGRVNATTRLASVSVQPLGAIAGGWAASLLGLQTTLAFAALGLALGSLPIALSPLRRLQTMPEPA
jgi:MFS family permease